MCSAGPLNHHVCISDRAGGGEGKILADGTWRADRCRKVRWVG